MVETELEFLRRRTIEELDLADNSEVPIAADVHRRLAVLYAQRVARMRATPWPENVEPMAMPQMSNRSR